MSLVESKNDDALDPGMHTILIVDDLPANLSLVAENFSDIGYKIKIAQTGKSGIKIALNQPPTLILLDVNLPDLDGFEVCRRLKKDHRTKDIPVIFMTAMNQTENKVLGFDVGGVDYITKPVNHQEVLARVNMQIRFQELTRKLKEAKQYLEQRVVERTSELAQVNENLSQEIIEREQIQEALIRGERDYRSLAENSPDNIIRYDSQCRAIYCNHSLEQSLGLESASILGKTPLETAPETSGIKYTSYEEKLRQVLNDGKSAEIEMTIQDSIGLFRTHRVRLTAERDNQGKIVSALAISSDITQQKLDEEALKHLNRELRAISDCNQVLVRAVNEQELLNEVCRIICDEAGYYLTWVGYTENEDSKSLRPAAAAGMGVKRGFLERLQDFWINPDYGPCLSGLTIQNGRINCINNFTTDPKGVPWRAVAAEYNFRSLISLPLKNETQHTFGVLNIYSTEVDAFTDEEQRLLQELAEDLAFGIVTLRRRIEHDKAEEQIRIAATAFEAQEGIVITDAKKRILQVNAAFTEITGYSSDEAVGNALSMLKSDHHSDAYYQTMWNTIDQNDAWIDEVWNRKKNGRIYPVLLNITAVKNGSGQITHYVSTMTDITERKAAAAEIEHLAYHDPLTLLPNRRLFLDQLEQALAAAQRSLQHGALLFIDLDNFKILNDTRGHDAGDQLLIEVSKRLLTCIRKEDTIARFGGDEFMIMLKDLGTNNDHIIEKINTVGQKILSSISQPYVIEEHTHHITPSLGITIFVGTQNSPQELLKQADIAMYQAKNDGRNRLRFFNPDMQAALAKHAALEVALRRGIEEQQLFLHYQAQVGNKPGIIGAEILLRWNHPERGLVPPDEFIPLAEESGLILPIGQWVFEQACKQLKTWSKSPRTCDLQLAVNVSQCQFRQPDFVDTVQRILVETEAPATHLKIELTESLLIKDIEDSINKMHAIKALGVEFSLDDFGTGYSSLSYLTRLPLQQLKIDRSFINHLPNNHEDAIVTQTIITMAKSLQISVIAEGVETEAQRLFLEQHGCHTYQGYLFSRPIPLIEFEALLPD